MANSMASPTVETPTQFSAGVLAANDWPQSPSNIQFLNEWQGAEGQWGATGSWNAAVNMNPLNLESVPAVAGVTPTGSQAATSTNNILTFGTWSDGINATAAFIKQPNYPAIQSALANGNAMSAFQSGTLSPELSTWGTNPANFATPAVAAPGGASATTTSAVSPASATPPTGAGSSAPATLMGACSSSTAIIKIPSVAGIGGGSLLNQCQAKALISAGLIGVGGVMLMIGVALLFTGAKGIAGKLGEVAGAGVALVPGGEAAGAAIAAKGHQVSKSAGQTRSQNKQNDSDRLDAAHMSGVVKGRSQGRQSNGLRTTVSSTPGAQFSDLSPGAEF